MNISLATDSLLGVHDIEFQNEFHSLISNDALAADTLNKSPFFRVHRGFHFIDDFAASRSMRILRGKGCAEGPERHAALGGAITYKRTKTKWSRTDRGTPRQRKQSDISFQVSGDITAKTKWSV